MYERFTDRARKVVHLAREKAMLMKHAQVEPHHILAGLMWEGRGVAAAALHYCDATFAALSDVLDRVIGIGHVVTDRPPLAEETKEVFLFAIGAAEELGHKSVGTEHLLLSLLRWCRQYRESQLQRIFEGLGIATGDLRLEVRRLLGVNKEKPTLRMSDLGAEVGMLVSLWSRFCAESSCPDDQRVALLDILGQDPHYKSILLAVRNACALLPD
ncbi:MAG TPA: Clp protease N-terminal domain-containing protein [Candidatus Andersenbacteria bacterium]|nr:Clp protease N-terminal domain-containing protein [Candidatus Andersenbacteria bacterium]